MLFLVEDTLLFVCKNQNNVVYLCHTIKNNNIMKAKTLVDYSEVKKGSEFKVVEIFGTRYTLLIEGRKVDFGISEVEIITNTRAEKFEVGRYIQGMFSDFTMRQSDIDNELKNIRFPLSKRKMNECVNTYLYAN